MDESGQNHRYDILEAIGQIAREKNVNRDLVVETIKAGLLSAAKKRFGESENITVNVDLNTGQITMEAEWAVVKEIEDPFFEINVDRARQIKPKSKVGDTVIETLSFDDFGRHAIHSAKQSLIQKVREAEREKVYNDYRMRIQEIVTGSVQQILHGDIYVNLGRAEAILYNKQQIKRERYHQGNTIRAIIIDVRNDVKGPQIILSRTDPKFLTRLFEIEVPEIYEGIVEIKGVARKPGERSKVAVISSDSRVDAVGACVGIKGSRVQGIVKELNNERIDIINYSEDLSGYLARALSPATVLRVDINRAEGKMIAIVEDDQLSLAIGKNGLNAELASYLTNMDVDIIGQSEFIQREAEKTKEAGLLIDMKGIGEKMVFKLNSHNINTIRDLVNSETSFLTQVQGVGPKTAEGLIEKAKEFFKDRDQTIEEDGSENSETAEAAGETKDAVGIEEE